MSVRDLLKKGFKKVVGNDSEVCLWEDPWVPTLPLFWVLTQVE